MWIMSKDGFISVVQHRDDPSKFRVRARRREHLQTYANSADIIDLGRSAPDYRFHADIGREKVAEILVLQLEGIDYETHAKEAMAGDDDVYYRALMGTWSKMHTLQERAERGLRESRVTT